MKKLIHSLYEFNIDVVLSPYMPDIAAATYKGIEVPDGDVIDGDKDARISEQMAADYEDFIAALETLLEDHYGMILTYKNASEDYSRYFNFLATDADGNIRFRFRLRLRVSNHKAHRSKSSQQHKHEEESSGKLKELIGDKPMPLAYPKTIIVNNKVFDSYEEAFIQIDNEIQRWVDVMTR